MNPRLTLMSGVAIVSLMVGTPTPFLATAFAQVSQGHQMGPRVGRMASQQAICRLETFAA